jgi:prepilin-type N-terminal cleavage/methylation domain-containing protein
MTLKPLARHHRGFTLIELLVVISIIALLAVGGMAGYQKVLNTVRQTKTQNTMVSVVNAINQFYNEYSTYPVQVGAGTDAMLTTDDGELIRTLIAKNDQLNTKRLNLLDGMKEARKGTNGMEDGIDFQSNPDNPNLLDPWGSPYRVMLDGDFDDKIENPDTANGGGRPIRQRRVVCWSAGKDRNFDTWIDNVKTW